MYRTLRNLIIRKSKEARKKRKIAWKKMRGNRHYITVKKFFGVRTPKCGVTKSKKREIIYEQEQVVDRLKKYLEALYDEEELVVVDLERTNEIEQDEEYVEHPVLKEKFNKNLRDLNPKKRRE